jgi:hypothetical protein
VTASGACVSAPGCRRRQPRACKRPAHPGPVDAGTSPASAVTGGRGLRAPHWWSGQKVLVAPRWASRVSWDEAKIFVNLSREAMKSSPPWDQTSAIHREYEEHLHDYYGLRGYWTEVAGLAARLQSGKLSAAGGSTRGLLPGSGAIAQNEEKASERAQPEERDHER